MRVEQQGFGECMLATIAALADVSLAEIRDVACAKAKVDHWSEALDTPVFNKTVRYLIKQYKVKGIPSRVTRRITPSSSKKQLGGQGSIRIENKDQTKVHIMPFEDGLIYDTNYPTNPFPISELETRYPTWKIIRITKTRQNILDKLKSIM